MPIATGQILSNRYRIVKLLGQGGFGAVYRAWDMNLKRPFALKENLELSPESVQQFELEASFLANLRHPNLPRVIDCFTIQGRGQYLVMDFIDGETLEEKMTQARGSLTETQVLPWFTQVCDALTFLHNQEPPIVHRDIKLANIKINPDGRAFLVDFGIAKVYISQQKTAAGARAVTKGYSPPEQYGTARTDARSDIYALGATLYVALTSQVPVESIQRRLNVDLISPSNINPAILPRTETAILKAMEFEMDERYQSIADFKVALATPTSVQPPPKVDIQGTVVASPSNQPASPPLTQPVGKSRFGMILGAVFVLVVFLCILAAGLGAFGGGLAFLEGTVTPTLAVRRATVTDEVTPTYIPANTRESVAGDTNESALPWDPTPTQVPPTFTKTPSVTPSRTPSKTPSRTPSPTGTTSSQDDSTGEWYPCENTYASRIHVGDKAYISHYPPLNNRVRSRPYRDASQIGSLKPGESMKILDGPACADYMVWWKVRSLENTNLSGWTSEGDRENYWLVPLP